MTVTEKKEKAAKAVDKPVAKPAEKPVVLGLDAALTKVQQELKAPKNQYNDFSKFYYRSAEDILEGVKPLLAKYELNLTLADTIIMVGDRYYIKATATLIKNGDSDHSLEVSAYAREDESKKGMDGSQVTGSSSSYARKYALNGMFLIDDTKDSDDDAKDKADLDTNVASAIKSIKNSKTAAEFKQVFNGLGSLTNNTEVIAALRAKKAEFTNAD